MTKPLAKDNAGRYACLLFDSTLKTVLGTAENEKLFIEMLEFLLPGKHISSLSPINKEYHGFANSEKSVTFDLLCRDDDTGEEFLVEVQNAPSDSYPDRVLYYSYYPLREQLAKKDLKLLEDKDKEKEEKEDERDKMDYSLKPVYVISFVNFELKHESEEAIGEGYVSRYELRNVHNGEVLTQALNFVFIEMDRLPFRKNEWEKCRTRMERFVFAFKYMHTFEEFPESFAKDPLLGDMAKAAKLANMPIKRLNEYERNMRTELDRLSEINTAKRIGREEGRAEGREEERAKNARNLLALGVDSATIAKATGLTEAKIAALK